MNVYVRLTDEFNRGRVRAMLSSGQAVVLHKLAIMSKDGDWVIREDADATGHILAVLASHGATYRFGAPLDERWLRGGWSASGTKTVRSGSGPTSSRGHHDCRPRRSPRRGVTASAFACGDRHPGTGRIKKTNREKDYAVIGELARRLPDVASQFLLSRSARDLMRLAE